jgi:hypothetical protein
MPDRDNITIPITSETASYLIEVLAHRESEIRRSVHALSLGGTAAGEDADILLREAESTRADLTSAIVGLLAYMITGEL